MKKKDTKIIYEPAVKKSKKSKKKDKIKIVTNDRVYWIEKMFNFLPTIGRKGVFKKYKITGRKGESLGYEVHLHIVCTRLEAKKLELKFKK